MRVAYKYAIKRIKLSGAKQQADNLAELRYECLSMRELIAKIFGAVEQ